MKLVVPSTPPKLGGDFVDALGDNERGTLDSLGQEVSQRPIETAREEDSVTVLDHQSERAVELKNSVQVTSEQPAPSLRFVASPEAL
jgi:hypothetical protein